MVPVTDQQNDSRKKRNRKLIRIAVFFFLANQVMLPSHRFIWTHSLLAFKLLLNFIYFAQRRLSTPVDDDFRSRLFKHLHYGLQFSKGLLAVNIFFYQCFYLGSCQYFISTLIYFVLAERYLQQPLTLLTEIPQLDILEGLESYYVLAVLSAVELFFSLSFILLALVRHNTQWLMLVALGTNVYVPACEMARDGASAALVAWATLAQFERASRVELREYDDVCAICLSPMTTARWTRCRHLFHGQCLRRALQEKAACPICSAPVHRL